MHWGGEGARGSSEHSEMNLWKQATSYVSELPVTGRVQAGTGWAASRRAGERTRAQSKRLGPPQAGPQLLLHSTLEVACPLFWLLLQST